MRHRIGKRNRKGRESDTASPPSKKLGREGRGKSDGSSKRSGRQKGGGWGKDSLEKLRST